ncbi:MAG: HupE/UreJ family protein [Hyphomicrobiaceae bacterium]|nr:HupE/UreJ family protein [Hyphomicrobiaceae bacterium]
MAPLGAALALAAATPALAHSGAGHVHSLASGFAHPFGGFDHLLAMVAVGLWAGLNGGRALWAWPAAFVGLMLAGGAVGAAHLPLALAEPGIIASVIALGIAVTASLRAPTALGAVVIGAFALLHGYAHGLELPAGASAAGYMAGFALATALLHSIGVTAATVAGQGAGRVAVRTAGAIVAAAGLALALS